MRITDYIAQFNDFKPQIGLVLGSGLGDFADTIQVVGELAYKDIDDFPHSTVSGHAGRYIFGYCSGKPVVIMQGRVHYYEGYAMREVIKPILAMVDMGIQQLILTNAAGGININFSAGNLMMITDHILNVPNPLIGKNLPYGERFPDMSNVYNKELCDIIRKVAREDNIDIKEGVYVQLSGPSYETPAEIRMWRTLGADAVGMSTACEAVVANYCGVKVCGISCITNLAAGMGGALNHEEVKREGANAKQKFARLITGVIAKI